MSGFAPLKKGVFNTQNKMFKNRIKKIFNYIATGVVSLGLISTSVIPVSAYEVQNGMYAASSIDGITATVNGKTQSIESIQMNYDGVKQTNSLGLPVDFSGGTPLFCLDPGIVSAIEAGQGMQPYVAVDTLTYLKNYFNDDEIAEDMFRKVNGIMQLGYGFDNDYSLEMKAATQLMLWKYCPMLDTGITNTVSGVSNSTVKAKMDLIEERVKLLTTKPNFSETQPLKLNLNETVQISDNNGVLGSYEVFKSPNGIEAEVKNGKLEITCTDSSLSGTEQTIRLTNIAYINERTPYESNGLIFKDDSRTDYQTLVCPGNFDPLYVSFKVKIEAGQLTLEKQDSETGKTAQGDATLTGAQYSLTGSDNKNYGTFTIGKNGKSNSIKDLDTSLTYTVKETKAPTGYILNTDTYTIEYTGDTTKINKVVKDNVIKGYLEITKILDTNDGESGLVSYEEGAEFTAILKSYADKVGGFDNALAEIKNGNTPLKNSEYSVMTTDDNGYAKSGALAYGTYYVKQTGAKDGEIKLMTTQIEAKISNQGEVKSYMASNKTQKYRLKLVKVNENGENITYSSATFKIKDKATGEYVSQQVGSKTYDTFTTYGDNVDEAYIGAWMEDTVKGEVVLPLEVKGGTYIIEEVGVPYNFIGFGTKEVNVCADFVEVGAEDDYFTIYLDNDQIKHPVSINKMFKYEGLNNNSTILEDIADRINKAKNYIQFEMTAKEDIIDYTTGAVKFKKGQVVATAGLSDNNDTAYFGEHLIGKYEIREKTSSQFFRGDKSVLEVEITKEGTKFAKNKNTFTNLYDGTKFSKEDVGGKEVEGAELTLLDEDGNVVDEWVSTSETHYVFGLHDGKKYTLKEVSAPNGYVLAQEIKFIAGVENDIHMVDERVETVKIDASGKAVVGAKFEVYDLLDNKIDEWVSSKESHYINGLVAGQTYIIKEVEAPKGYVKMRDRTFVATEQVIKMVNTQVQVHKLDNHNEHLKGAKLQVKDSKGKVVDEWTTDEKGHIVKNLTVGETYILHEKEAPKGYAKAKDIEFVPKANGKNEIITMVDNQVVPTGIHSDKTPLYMVGGAVIVLLGLGGYVAYDKFKKKKAKKSE